MKTFRDIEYLQGVRVLVRADFNVPIKDGVVADDYRIRMTLPTIEYLSSRGAKVILMSHLEATDGSNPSLGPVATRLGDLGISINFVKNIRNAPSLIEAAENSSCFLLENLRQFPGEKVNDQKFAKELSSLADIYVNDAFSVSHREHASVVGVPKYLPSYAGLQIEKEISHLSRAFDPTHPFLFILGGAKFETKLPLLQKFVKIADTVFVGGALACDLFKAKGYEVGKSVVSDGDIDLKGYVKDSHVILPIDVVNQDHENKMADSLAKTDQILDSGVQTIEMLREKISQARFVLWNGPLGLYEDGYQNGTQSVAEAIARSAENREAGNELTSIVGGGDTLAAISTLGLEDKYTFVSTAGGAMLEFLAKGTLPGVEALG